MATKIGILRCPDNHHKCPLTGCFKCMHARSQGFASYDEPLEIMGVFTLEDSLETNIKLAKVMKAKGVEVIHLVTCAFAHKKEGKWFMGEGFLSDPEKLMSTLAQESGLPCVMGAAHLPEGYEPQRF